MFLSYRDDNKIQSPNFTFRYIHSRKWKGVSSYTYAWVHTCLCVPMFPTVLWMLSTLKISPLLLNLIPINLLGAI